MKKRLLFLVTLLVTAALMTKVEAQSIAGSTDVTNTYLTNPSFEYSASGTQSTTQGLTNGGTYYGWNLPSLGTSYVNISIGDASTCNGQAFGIPTATDGSFYYFARRGWNSSSSANATMSTSMVNLPVGLYSLTLDYKGIDSWDNSHNSKGSYFVISAVENNATLASVQTPNFTAVNGNSAGSGRFTGDSNWQNITLTFSVTTAGDVTLNILHHLVGGIRTDVVIDNLNLTYQDPELANKLVELKGVVKKAKALNTVLNNANLTHLIETVEATTYSSVADMNIDMANIKSYYENLETVAITNGNFDTNPVYDASGTLNANAVQTVGTNGSLYEISGFSNSNSGGEWVYGLNAEYGCNTNVMNNTAPPAADMFGNAQGAALGISSGWGNQTRYAQELTSLPAGKYIFYYEAYNQNSSTGITDNYFGISNVEAGNITDNSSSFVYSGTKTFTAGEWQAEVVPFTLIAPEDAATVNLGLANSGSSNAGAKLWIDNVTIYYLGWDSSEALSNLQDLVDQANTMLAQQMNQDFKAPLATAAAAAQTLINNSSTSYDDISAAQLALATAVSNAQPSVTEYAKINNYLTLLGNQLGSIPVATYQAADVFTKYSDGQVNGSADSTTGTYESLDEVLPLYKAFVADYWTTNAPQADDDLTAFIVNQGFEFGDLTAWTLPNGSSSDTGAKNYDQKVGNYLFNTWWQGKPVQQTIANLPNGTYRLTAALCSGDDGTDGKAFLTANGTHSDVITLVYDAERALADYSFEFVVLDGNATIGAIGGNTDGTYADGGYFWYRADNFRLTYLSDDFLVAPELPEGQMNAQVKEDMLAAEAAFEADKSHENYDALIAAIDAAKASINVYNQIFIYTNAFTLESQRGDIADADARAMAFFTKYSDGEVNGVADPTTGSYTTLEEVTAEYTANVKNYWSNTGITANSDITALVINNGFETRDVTGWNVNYGNDTGAKENSNATYTIDIANGDYVFNTWSSDANTSLWLVQTITDLPDGLYEVKAIVASENNINVEFTANEVTDASTHSDKAVGEERTINVVVSDGKLDVGAHANGFFKADYFRVKYLGEEVPVSMKPEIPSGPMNKDVLAALNAADAAFDAAGGNTATNYNALVEAIDAANASIAIYQVINTRIPYLDAQKGAVNIDELTTKYIAGDYVNADDVIYAYHALVVDQIGNNPADGTDMTPYIINPMPNFESEFWWNISKPNDGNGPMKGTEEFEYWIGTAADGNFNYSQWIADLPNGTYSVSAEMYNSLNSQAGEFSPAVAVYGTTPLGEQTALVDVEGETFNTYTATNIIVSDGTITIGAKNINPMTARWTVFKNFRLTFISKDVPADMQDEINDVIEGIDTTKPMNSEEKDAYIAAKNAWEQDPSAANYAAVKAAAEVAKNSIEAYAKAKEGLDKALEATTKTNVYTFDAYNKFMDQYNRYLNMYEAGGLTDDVAATIQYVFFGNRAWHQEGVPVVELLGSAWDDAGDYTWQAGDYWINTWSGEGDNDGSNYIVPFMEYWVAENQILADKVLNADVQAEISTNYVVTAELRARVADGNAPTGIKMQIVSDLNGETVYSVVPTWTQVGESLFWTASVELTGSSDVVDSNQDGLGDLHIQFVIEGTNASWFCFKDAFATRETPLSAQEVNDLVNNLQAAAAAYEATNFGFETGEIAPYNNAEKIKAAVLCENFARQIEALHGDYSHIPNYIMMNQALQAWNNSGNWVENECEQNAFFWTDDYSAEDVEVITFYNEDGSFQSLFRTIYPTGWELGGRADAYNTRIIKFGVNDKWNSANADDQGIYPGLKSVSDQTVFFTKQDTHYGDQPGYTLPLKAGKTYYLSFVYCDYDEGKMPTTNINIHLDGNENIKVNDITYPSFKPITIQGNLFQDRWYYYRATFTVPQNGNYIFELNKERNDGYATLHEQRQTGIGDLVLVLADNSDVDMPDAVSIDGQSTDFDAADQTPEFDYNPAQVSLTRNFNVNGTDGTWNTIMVPFNLDFAETKENFGIEEIAYYTGTEDTDIGIKLLFETRRTGLKANQPVMVFYNADSSKPTLDNAVMVTRNSLASNDVDDSFSSETRFKPVLIGNSSFSGIEKDDESRFVIKDPNGKFDFVGTYQTLHIPYYGVYINASNQWRQSTGKTGLQPTRAYFREVAGDGTSTAKLLGFSIDDMPTGIIAIEEDGEMHVTSGNIYTIDGRLVRQNATGLEGLEPGIYVVDGKKYIIK